VTFVNRIFRHGLSIMRDISHMASTNGVTEVIVIDIEYTESFDWRFYAYVIV